MEKKTNARNCKPTRDELRTNCATALFSAEEKAMLAEAAKNKGMTISTFIRMLVLDYINGSK